MHSIRGFAMFVDPQRTYRPVGRELRLRCSWNRTLGVPLPKTDLWPGSRHFFLCTWGDRSIGLEAHEMGFSSTLSGKGRRLMQYCHSAYTAILILRNILLHVPLNYEELWSQILSYYLSRRHRSYTFFFISHHPFTHTLLTRYASGLLKDLWFADLDFRPLSSSLVLRFSPPAANGKDHGRWLAGKKLHRDRCPTCWFVREFYLSTRTPESMFDATMFPVLTRMPSILCAEYGVYVGWE